MMTTLLGTAAAVLLALVFVLIFIIIRLTGTGSASPDERMERLDKIDRSLEELNRIFLLPYKRGTAGETLLYDLLNNYLPPKSFETQYHFTDGTICDAAIFLGNYKIAIDSKFPLNSLLEALESGKKSEVRKNFTKHISDIATKYIQPAEGTLGFALMYIPSEKIYYEAFVRDDTDLLSEALAKNVIPAGPSSLFLYIQTVSYGLRGFLLSADQADLRRLIAQVKNDIISASKTSDLARNHLKNLIKALDESRGALEKAGQSADRLP